MLTTRTIGVLLFAALGSVALGIAPAQAEERLSDASSEAITESVMETTANHDGATVVEEERATEDIVTDVDTASVNNATMTESALPMLDDDSPSAIATSDQEPATTPAMGQTEIPNLSDLTTTSSDAATLGVVDLEAIAQEDSMAQVTSVTQLSDVLPTDWAYQALSGLIERYGCIAGYPDGTFRGNQPLSRYEFAAGLNACLEGFAAGVNPGDAGTLEQLQAEFATELASLRGRVDSLEARLAELEANQFSTTTKLFGQVIMGVQGRNDYEFNSFRDTLENETEINFVTNVQLSLLTQFDSRSLLLAGLQAGDGSLNTTPGLTDFTRLGYEGDTDNDFELSDLSFRHLVGRDLAIIVGPRGLNAVNTFRGTNRVESAGFGPLSRFAQRNPIIGIGSGTGGIGFDWQMANWASLQGVYSTSDPSDVNTAGLFGGDTGTTTFGAQLVVSPSNNFDVSFQYMNSYSPFGRLFTGVGDDQVAIIDGTTGRAPIQTNAFGASVEWRVASSLTTGGWFGYTDSDLLGESGSVETINWMAFLNFPDLFGDGNLAGLYVGQPPRITDSDLPSNRNIPSLINRGEFPSGPGGQPSTTTHVEAFYRWRLNDNITLTPGVILVFNPGHNDDNDTVVIGAIRTTFTF
jgi:hypothetical protein